MQKTNQQLIGILVVVAFVGILGATIAAGSAPSGTTITTANSNPTISPESNQPSAKPAVPKSPSKTGAVSISRAIQNYSEAAASNVDVLGVVTSLQPAQSDSVLASWGNTILIKDGSYGAAVHDVSVADFQKLSLGDEVEVKGGYMQDPSNDAEGGGWVVQIFHTISVEVVDISSSTH